jgi:hypothetical protein
VIRADWTPLWAADRSNRKALGGRQIAMLEACRDRGPLTWAQMRADGFTLQTRDTLSGSGRCYPRLLAFDTGHPQRHFLAAPGQQRELDMVLAALASGQALPDYSDMDWRGAIESHLEHAGIARWFRSGYALIPVADRAANMAPFARKIVRAMQVPQWAVAA